MRIVIALLYAGAALAPASAQDGFVYWPAAKLKGYSASLKAKEPTVSGSKKSMMAIEQLGNRGNFSFMVARRAENGEAEVHAGWNDVFVAQERGATLIYGGKSGGGYEKNP